MNDPLKKYQDLSQSELRSLLLEYFSTDKIFERQGRLFEEIRTTFHEFLGKKNILPTNQVCIKRTNDPNFRKLQEVLWSLAIEQLITVSWNGSDSLGFYFLTEYGKIIINSDLPIPQDPDGYLARVKREIPNIDTIIFTYLAESIHTYNINMLLASATTLGCASEKAMTLLISAFSDFLPNSSKIIFEKSIKGKFIKTQFEEFQKRLPTYKGNLPDNLQEGMEIGLNAVFEIFRQTRNEAGHPSGNKVSKDNMFCNLQVFIPYCKKIYDLIEYFNKNSIISP